MKSIAPTFDQYANKFEHIALERQDGILTIRLHTDGGPLKWGAHIHEELGYCFTDVGTDRDNKVVIITGTGDAFINDFDAASFEEMSAEFYDQLYYDGKRLLDALLSIEVPVIGAVNGPAMIHAALAVLSDIVIASDDAVFGDFAHWPAGVVPGDGLHIVWPHLIGANRARYFLLTGQVLDATTAHDLGVVSEVLPKAKVMERALELARSVAAQPILTRRYTRVAFTHEWKRLMHNHLGYGLALEGMGAWGHWPN